MLKVEATLSRLRLDDAGDRRRRRLPGLLRLPRGRGGPGLSGLPRGDYDDDHHHDHDHDGEAAEAAAQGGEQEARGQAQDHEAVQAEPDQGAAGE